MKKLKSNKELILDIPASQNQGNTHQRLWQAVIDTAIIEWMRGPFRHKHKAEYFLFRDEDDFAFVCRSAGLNPESVRESLWAARAKAAVGSHSDAA